MAVWAGVERGVPKARPGAGADSSGRAAVSPVSRLAAVLLSVAQCRVQAMAKNEL